MKRLPDPPHNPRLAERVDDDFVPWGLFLGIVIITIGLVFVLWRGVVV